MEKSRVAEVARLRSLLPDIVGTIREVVLSYDSGTAFLPGRFVVGNTMVFEEGTNFGPVLSIKSGARATAQVVATQQGRVAVNLVARGSFRFLGLVMAREKLTATPGVLVSLQECPAVEFVVSFADAKKWSLVRNSDEPGVGKTSRTVDAKGWEVVLTCADVGNGRFKVTGFRRANQ